MIYLRFRLCSVVLTPVALSPSPLRSALFGTNRTVIVGLGGWLMAITDGVSVAFVPVGWSAQAMPMGGRARARAPRAPGYLRWGSCPKFTALPKPRGSHRDISELGDCTSVHYVHFVHFCALFSADPHTV